MTDLAAIPKRVDDSLIVSQALEDAQRFLNLAAYAGTKANIRHADAALIARMQKDMKEARERLVQHRLKLVVKHERKAA